MFFAPNGASALPAAEENKIDAIVLDINLRNMSGLRVCKILKQSQNSKYPHHCDHRTI